jgi:hypothetical protein
MASVRAHKAISRSKSPGLVLLCFGVILSDIAPNVIRILLGLSLCEYSPLLHTPVFDCLACGRATSSSQNFSTCAIENLPSNACEPDSIIARMSHAEINRPFSSQNGLIFMELK